MLGQRHRDGIFVPHQLDHPFAPVLVIGGEADLLHRHFLPVAQVDGAVHLAAAAFAERVDADELAADRPFSADGLDAAGVLQHRVEMLGALALQHLAADALGEIGQPRLDGIAQGVGQQLTRFAGLSGVEQDPRRHQPQIGGAHGERRIGVALGQALEVLDG